MTIYILVTVKTQNSVTQKMSTLSWEICIFLKTKSLETFLLRLQILESNRMISKRLKKLLIMCLLPKMHKTPTGGKFVAPSEKCSTKSNGVTKAFKLTFMQILY